MRTFNCGNCGRQVYFENTHCVHCKSALGFEPSTLSLLSLSEQSPHSYCENFQHNICNWLVDDNEAATSCLSCSLNNTTPDLDNPEHTSYWQKIESAKRRLLYSLLKLKLPVEAKKDNESSGIWFDFLADKDDHKVMTGHNQGLITLNIAEADSVARESNKKQLGEPYRTLLGHFRHEIGHYYWDHLIASNDKHLDQCRALFGDDREDYGEALKAHYNRNNDHSWSEDFVSFYASSHPWEDWAETWAHYLHIIDALDTASHFNMEVSRPTSGQQVELHQFDPYHQGVTINDIIEHWLPMTYALNSINRSMGLNDFYPFVLAPAVIKKLGFVHKVISRQLND